jgi:uncharacterized protein (DUF58 family)
MADDPTALAWDPNVLARVRHLHLRARYLTAALLVGEHRSRRVGQAVEFADYQPYLPGMDLRGLDWRVWARTDRLVVKRFETETELPASVVLDLSGDLGTGDGARAGALPDLDTTKAGYAITLAATLLYFLHLHGEPWGSRSWPVAACGGPRSRRGPGATTSSSCSSSSPRRGPVGWPISCRRCRASARAPAAAAGSR